MGGRDTSRRLQRRTLLQPERLTYSSRGQVPLRDAAHGNPNTRSIRPCRGRINVASRTPQNRRPLQGRAVRWRRHPGAALRLPPSITEQAFSLQLPGLSARHFQAGLQSATPPADSVTDPPGNTEWPPRGCLISSFALIRSSQFPSKGNRLSARMKNEG